MRFLKKKIEKKNKRQKIRSRKDNSISLWVNKSTPWAHFGAYRTEWHGQGSCPLVAMLHRQSRIITRPAYVSIQFKWCYAVEGEQGPVRSRFHWATSGRSLRRWHSGSVRPELKAGGGFQVEGATWGHGCARNEGLRAPLERGASIWCVRGPSEQPGLWTAGAAGLLLFSSSVFGCLGATFSPSILPQTDAKVQSYRRAKGQINTRGGLAGRAVCCHREFWGMVVWTSLWSVWLPYAEFWVWVPVLNRLGVVAQTRF